MGTRIGIEKGFGAARMAMFAAVALVAFAVSAGAGKPPPSSSVDTGTIYYGWNTDLWSMLPDGSGATDVSSVGRATLEKHDGKRWYLQWQAIADADPYPTRQARCELFAVTDEGDSVQLTDAPLVEPNFPAPDGAMHTWANDDTIVDGKISYLGTQWVDGGENPDYVDEANSGLFVLTIEWEKILYTGSDPDLMWVPGLPVVESNLAFIPFEVVHGTGANAHTHSVYSVTYCWSPDGSKVAYLDRGESTPTLGWKAIDGSSSKALVKDGYSPRWSTAGTDGVIAFSPLVRGGGIQTIKPDGSGLTTLVGAPSQGGKLREVNYPVWSPNGTHLVYAYWEVSNATSALKYVIYRVAASGGTSTSLTSASKIWMAFDWVK